MDVTDALMLDCETYDSSAVSLAAILGVGRDRLESWMRGFDLAEHLAGASPAQCDYAGLLLRSLETELGVGRLPGWSGTCYFHFTRALDPSRFRRGILPLCGVLVDEVWASLYSLVRDEVSLSRWDELRREVSADGEHPSARRYRTRTEKPETQGGPYALLVLEHSQCPGAVGSHDYLALPEVVQDLGEYCASRLGIDLCGRFQRAATPCVVKFRTDEASGDALEAAAAYVCETARGWPPSRNAVCAYTNRGRAVIASDVKWVECPPGRRIF
jgi:hypothetical protein